VLQDILDKAVDLHLGILGLREIHSSKFMRVFNGLLTSNWALGFPKYTTGFQSHALVFIIFSGCATLESNDRMAVHGRNGFFAVVAIMFGESIRGTQQI
jgi:hypothetical protein